MRITVRLYSIARHRGGQIVDRLELELPAACRVQDILTELEINPDLEAVVSVNNVVCDVDTLLADGDEVAVIPAVAGG